jgi:acyl-CoA thioester hydrolase
MDSYKMQMQLRWSDFDPMFHVRHSVYHDWAAFIRIEFLNAYGLTASVMQELKFGPILFREECMFRKEIRSGDVVEMNVELLKSKKDFSRWSFRHQITKNQDTLSAILTVDGAWMDLTTRKLAPPPAKVNEVFSRIPRAGEFEWT